MRANAFLPPSCHASSPQSVRTTVPSGLVTGLPGEILLPTSTTRRAAGSFLCSGLLHHCIDTGQFSGRDTGEQVIERQHRVRLAAAEVGLELDYWVAALAGEALHRTDQHPL